MRRLAVAALAVAVAGGASAACSSSPPAEVNGPFQTCAAVAATGSAPAPASAPATASAPAPAGSAPAPAGSAPAPTASAPAPTVNGGTAAQMAAITLPCFAGGAPVRLDALGRPAVLNLWASWCGPCRSELPIFQRYADSSGGAVTVLGVVTNDTRAAAAAFAEDVSVTFPSVFDKDSAVQRSGLTPVVLPVTLFVDAQGRVRHVEAAPIPDLSTLESLIARYLDVRS
jgi:thiol-disulfide isomerase/thioredoxin